MQPFAAGQLTTIRFAGTVMISVSFGCLPPYGFSSALTVSAGFAEFLTSVCVTVVFVTGLRTVVFWPFFVTVVFFVVFVVVVFVPEEVVRLAACPSPPAVCTCCSSP